MPFWAPLALTVTAAGLLAVPVAPALYELRKRQDAAPLPTSRHDGRISNFAETFQSRLEPLLRQLEETRNNRLLSRASIDGLEALLVGCDEFDFGAIALEGVDAVMFQHATLVPAGVMVQADIYSESAVEVGEGAIVRAILASGDVVLKGNNTVLRWLHSRGKVQISAGTTANGRLSAEHSIEIEKACRFQRLHTPIIFTVSPAGLHSLLLEHESSHYESKSDSAASREPDLKSEPSRRRVRVRGDFILPAGEVLDTNVIATGDVRIGRGARLRGSIKSYKATVLEDQSSVNGSIVSEGAIRIGQDCFISGPLAAEDEITIASGTCIGTADALSTVSARRIRIAIGCQLHGTVWAREWGTVED